MTCCNFIQKTLFFLLFLVGYIHQLQAQDNPVIDSLICYVRNLQDRMGVPPSDPGNPDYKSQEIELTLVFNIQGINRDSLKQVNIKIGTLEGRADLKSVTINNTEEGRKSVHEKASLSFVEEKVVIRMNVPALLYDSRAFLTLKVKDTSGSESNTISKIFN